jgi:transposase
MSVIFLPVDMELHVKIEIVRLYYASNSCPTAALRSYKREHNLRNDPFSIVTIQRIIQRFEETGSVEDRPRSGRPSLQKEREHVVETALRTTTTAIGTSSTRRISEEANIPQSSVYRILVNKMKLFPYHLRISHALCPTDKALRLEFATWFQEQEPDFISNVIWSDEAYFALDGYVNTHNSIVWGTSRPQEPIIKSMFPPKVLVWMGVSATCVLRPFFFDSTVTSDRYLSMLQEHLLPELRRLRKVRSAVFMQDGAPPHVGNQVKDFLHAHFTEDRIISRHFKNAWPPRSPDLNPCDFWLWGALKEDIYSTKPDTIDELKCRIYEAVSRIKPADVSLAVSNLYDRLDLLAERKGELFEHLL